ncbi:LysR family transcriptional regulator [Anaeromicropila herbilytica]|uniref:LysR family transcriptional regulator n=1 Tax=Anaeromicropila herbilytica TaxID=2785025 RepID=A0A7R7EPM5_9FIRM|nr:LysR family transcriptional regulator [Anaeromicropila herbilytica]BCN32667.1 LysR family transcriptional regulator [Anaeromicropila herbilytica]
MELLQLKYFQTVARLEHMTRAAEELHIPQPALSKTISLLEKELDVLLFDRRGKYIYLNEYGKTFLKSVNQALTALENGKNELNDLSQKTFGDIKLVILSASSLIPDLLASFHKQYPHINFDLIQHHSSSVSPVTFDFCIYSSALKLENNNNIPLITEEIFLAVPSEHALAKRNSIRLNEVAHDEFISLKRGKDLREITDAFCKYAGFTPNIIFESDDPAMVRGLIRAGQGIAFMPSISWGGTTSSSIKLLHIEEPICERTISLSFSGERYLPLAARLFRQFTIDYFNNLRAQEEEK